MALTAKKGPAFKPQLLVCYLCGQQFGTSSLGLHVPQCYAKKTAQWDHADPATRGRKPRHPDSVNWQHSGGSTEEYNSQQFSEFANNLEPCPNCGRKFLPDRLVVHLRSCKTPDGRPHSQAGGGARPASQSSGKGTQKGPAFKPQLLVCYLCGQQFGTSSLSIHVPQCYAKKTAQWEAADPATRGRKPRHPDSVNWQHSGGSNEEYNSQQFSEFANNLEPCPNCGRKFLPDRLVVHLRSCKATNPASRPPPPAVPSDARPATQGPRMGRAGAPSSDAEPPRSPPAGTLGPRPISGALRPSDIRREDAPPATSPLRSRLRKGQAPSGRECPQCGAVEFADGAKFCHDCGTALKAAPPPSNDVCPSCGETVTVVGNFCDHCGASMAEGGASDAAMTCRTCGELYPSSSKFCEDCGEALHPASPPRTLPTDSPGASATPSPTALTKSGASVAKPSKAPARPPPTYHEPPPPDDGREQCPTCHRLFTYDALGRHTAVCGKVKARRVFDSRKHRVQGTEAAAFTRVMDQAVPQTSSSAWKAKSDEFRKAMQDARRVDAVLKKGGTAKDLPPPTYSQNAHYTACPHCGRRFAPDVAQRHIPKCATTANKPKPPPQRRR